MRRCVNENRRANGLTPDQHTITITWSSTQSIVAWYAPHRAAQLSRCDSEKRAMHFPSYISKPSLSHAIERDGALEGARGVGTGEVEGAELGRLPFVVWQTHRLVAVSENALQKPRVRQSEDGVRLSLCA